MKTAMAALVALLATASLSTNAFAACNSPTKVAKGPDGKTKVVCLDGKYSTCMRDSQSLGWSFVQAKRYCDSRNLQK
jgi:hypothetical protein